MAEHHGRPDPIAEFIGREPGMAQQMLDQHTDDGTGHCLVCPAGPQAGREILALPTPRPCRAGQHTPAERPAPRNRETPWA